MLVVLLAWLALPWLGHARAADAGRDYLLVGEATSEPTTYAPIGTTRARPSSTFHTVVMPRASLARVARG